MNLLIATQVVDANDPVLGFFLAWIEEFARIYDQVTVVCLKAGNHTLPNNVRVLSLGKETGASRLKYVRRFFSYVWRERARYDHVFVHMNPEYVILGGLLWRMLGKRVAFWYTHGSVNGILRAATILTHTVFTASTESFRIHTHKVHVVGHGIDVERFATAMHKLHVQAPRLISVGRISPTKRQHLAIEALSSLRSHNVDASLTLVGTPLTNADQAYETRLREICLSKSLEEHLCWQGAVPNEALHKAYFSHDVLIHTSTTGSLDKVVLEALAAGLAVVTTSDAVVAALPRAGPLLIHAAPGHAAIADAVRGVEASPDMQEKTAVYIAKNHSLQSLVAQMAGILER